MHDSGQLDDDADEATALSVRAAPRMPQSSWNSDDWPYYDFANLDEGTAGDLATGFTSIGFVRAALKRRMRLWIVTAVVGLLIGLTIFSKFPASYQATASILIANGPNVAAGAPIMDDQAMAQSLPVASAALRMLGLHENAAAFTSDYTATIVTDRVLQITVKAASSDEAVRQAQALASAFLAYQRTLLDTQNSLINQTLQQQLNQAQRHVDALTSQITKLSAKRSSPEQQTELTGLRAEHTQAVSELNAFNQAITTSEATNQEANTATIKGTQLLSQAALVPQHRKKRIVEYAGAGLVGGLALGMAIVVVGGLVSDRLRRRSDVAHALGAPVRLSVGKIRPSRARRGLAIAETPEMRQVVAYLHSVVPPSSRGPASLAVIPVGDQQVPAICLVSLAISYAQKGTRVVVADLCGGAPAARLLGSSEPGVRAIAVQGAHLVVAVPTPDNLLLAGPLTTGSRTADASPQLVAACASADVLLTLAALDPSLGADHLRSWAAGAVVVVTAGQSTAVRVRSVGEMTRLSGTPLISAVLIGADKTDESLGLTRAGAAARDADVSSESDRSGRYLVTLRGTAGRERPGVR
jgi:hypothetical protein